MSTSANLLLFVNGKKVEVPVSSLEPTATLSELLRNHLNLKSTKIGCGKGVCGACTVMVSSFNPSTKTVNHRAVNACIKPVWSVNNMAITTVEGLGSVSVGLHEIQERFTLAHASQCGFCTPGFVMAFYALLRSNPEGVEGEEIVANMDGNLCRCTGYRPIFSAMDSFAKNCCMKDKKEGDGTVTSCCMGLEGKKLESLDVTKEPIFPHALRQSPSAFNVKIGDWEWHSPTDLDSVLKLLKEKKGVLVGGNNSYFVLDDDKRVLVDTTHVPELSELKLEKDGLNVGGGVTLGDILNALKKADSIEDNSTLGALCEHLSHIGNTQLRNTITVGGITATNEEIGDFVPFLIASGAKITMLRDGKKIEVSPSNYEVTGNDLILSIHIPQSDEKTFVRAYKHSRRDTTSRTIVTAVCRVSLEDDKVKDCAFTFSGIANRPKSASNLEAYLKDKPWTPEVLSPAIQNLNQDLHGDIDARIEDTDEYKSFKKNLVESSLYMFFYSSFAHFQKNEDDYPKWKHPQMKSQQTWETTKSTTLHNPVPHSFGDLHTTGEAKYVADVEPPESCLFAALILSDHVHAKILEIDDSKARSYEGVEAIYYAKDLASNAGLNEFHDDVLFADKEVVYFGQPIGVLVAKTEKIARTAATLVQVKYEDLPAVLSIDEAIEKKAFFPPIPIPLFPAKVDIGDVEKAFKEADVVIEGNASLQAGEHYYMEPNCALAIPGERDEMTVYFTTQSHHLIQDNIARVLGIHFNQVKMKTKRLGGGFGGKHEFVIPAPAAAFAAHKLKKPVKLALDRTTDMLISGHRGQFKAKYKIAADKEGNLLATKWDIYNDAGYRGGFSSIITMAAMTVVDGCYFCPNRRLRSFTCRTNKANSTALRGAGNPQGMAFAEIAMDHLADELKMDPIALREKNFVKKGQATLKGPMNENFEKGLQTTWDRLKKQAEWEERVKNVEKFNAEHKYKKRGIYALPTKYDHMHLFMRMFFRGNATVSIFHDGSVLVTHAGIEMGQGLIQKVRQIAAECLGVPLDLVYTPTTDNYLTPNGPGTGGSTGTDVEGYAVIKACEELNKRLAPLKEKMEGKSWQEIIGAASQMKLNLTAIGRFDLTADEELNKIPVLYYSWNALAVEVELDCLTGAWHIARCDCVEDVGKSLNPAIDIGQIEGAFVQAMSWLTSEEYLWDKEGKLLVNPEQYEIADARSAPIDFRVSLVPNTETPNSVVFGSKSIGEPPYCMGIAGGLALKDAVKRLRKEIGLPPIFKFDFPATRARLRGACGDLLAHLKKGGAELKQEE